MIYMTPQLCDFLEQLKLQLYSTRSKLLRKPTKPISALKGRLQRGFEPWPIKPHGTPLFEWDHVKTHGPWLKGLCSQCKPNLDQRMDYLHFFLLFKNIKGFFFPFSIMFKPWRATLGGATKNSPSFSFQK